MKEDKRKVNEVRDRPTEVWIKMLFAVTAIAVALVAYMGDRFIVNQDKLIDGQNRTTEEVGKINGNLQAYESRISRNEQDVKEVRDVTTNHEGRIIKLEGAK